MQSPSLWYQVSCDGVGLCIFFCVWSFWCSRGFSVFDIPNPRNLNQHRDNPKKTIANRKSQVSGLMRGGWVSAALVFLLFFSSHVLFLIVVLPWCRNTAPRAYPSVAKRANAVCVPGLRYLSPLRWWLTNQVCQSYGNSKQSCGTAPSKICSWLQASTFDLQAPRGHN